MFPNVFFPDVLCQKWHEYKVHQSIYVLVLKSVVYWEAVVAGKLYFVLISFCKQNISERISHKKSLTRICIYLYWIKTNEN